MTGVMLAALAALAALAGCAPAVMPARLALVGELPVCAPDDGLDDRPCIQAQLDAACAAGGGTVHLATGRWELSRAPQTPGSRDNGSLWMECSDLALEGDGPATELAMVGDGLASDWAGIRIAGSPLGAATERVSVSDMTIQSDAAANLNEQTHLLYLGSAAATPGAISEVQLHYLWLRHPVRPEVAGDCLRFVGDLAAPITYVDAGPIVFEACDRSGVAIQRAVQHVNLHDSMMLHVGKTGVDMEPSGAGEIAWWTMRGLDLADSGITIAGQASTWTHDVILADSHVAGRVGVIYARDVAIIGATIAEVAAGPEGTLNLRAFERLSIAGTIVRRMIGSAPGPPVKISGASGSYPTGLIMAGDHITTEIAGPAIDAESVQDWTLAESIISGGDTTVPAVSVRATGRAIGGLSFTHNRIRGGWLYAFRIAGAPSDVVGALVTGTLSTGAASAGLRCENPMRFTASVVHGGNYYQGAAAATSGCATVAVLPASP